MSELLNTLHDAAPSKSWAQEVADAGASEPAPAAPEPAQEAVAPEIAEQVQPKAEAAVEPPQAPETPHEEPDRRVPLKALQEERQKRAELERRLAEIEEWASRASQPQQEPEQEPDPETDPIGALKYERAKRQALEQQTQAATYERQITSAYQNAAQEFAAQTPDFKDAYGYALASRAQELEAIGTPSHVIRDTIRAEEMQLVAAALQNRMNPAEAMYRFAKARGYQGKAPAPAPQPVAPAPAPLNPELQNAKKAVAASVAAGGAPAKGGELSLNDIANLKGAAFDAAWEKHMRKASSSMFRE